jgi:predicted RNA-binding protein with PIN domain
MVALGYEVDDDSRKKALEDGKALKKALNKLLGTLGISITLAGIVKFGKDSVQAASDVEQMEQKFDVVFDNLSDSADEWADNLADSIGRSKNSIKTYLADSQNLFVGFGMARDAAMEMSEQLTESAIDIASFSNLDDDTAIKAMTKAVMGESESAKTLGAVLNDTTRAAAMAELGYSGTYDSLDQLSKMQVNYTAIMQQSQDAIGDAARSMDSYESKNRQLQAQLKDIKENVGKFILPYMTKGLEVLSKITKKVQEATGKLGDVNEEGTIANKAWTKFTEIGEKAKTIIDKVVMVGKSFISMLGGTENALKLVMTVIAAIMAYKSAGKILKVVESLKSVTSVLSGINLKMLAIIAVIVLAALLVEDFIGFLQGKDSLFGTLLKNAGVDVDAVRDKFYGFRDDLMQIFDYIKELCKPVFDGLVEFWDEHGEEIIAYAQNLFTGIVNGVSYLVAAIQPYLQFVINLVKALFAFLTGDTDGAIEALKTALEGFHDYITNLLNALLAFLDGIFGGLPSKALEWGKDMLQGFINGISEKISALKEKITGIGDAIKEKLHFSKPDNGPLADADTWTPDMMDLLASGIESGKEKIKSAVTGVAGLIKGVIAGDSGTGASALADSATATAGTISSAMTGSTTYNITQNNSFSNTFNGGETGNNKTASAQLTKDAHDSTVYLAHAMALGR